ncbi:hypothetical protein [Brevundimonas vitis]|nr:hypothetical protein [Brevundimonas vitisensis]
MTTVANVAVDNRAEWIAPVLECLDVESAEAEGPRRDVYGAPLS